MSETPELDRTDQLTPDVRAVVLVLHGGAEKGTNPVSWRGLAVLRLLPFAWAIDAATPDDIAVVRLKYARRGWNGRAAHPLHDAHWALDEIATRTAGAPVVLVGHSMGGRVGLNLLARSEVIGFVGLAPWVVPSDRVSARPGQGILLRHARRDRITSAAATARIATLLERQGADVELEIVDRDNHAMLARPWEWHQRTARFVAQLVAALPARS